MLTGLDKIEFLQSHNNIEVYQKAFDIIEKYFGTDEEESNIVPSVDENAQQFTFGAQASGTNDANNFQF
jgi:importin subunit alpha-1